MKIKILIMILVFPVLVGCSYNGRQAWGAVLGGMGGTVSSSYQGYNQQRINTNLQGQNNPYYRPQ